MQLKNKYVSGLTFFLLAIVFLFFGNTSCKKDVLLSNGGLQFSVDTVLFDTVFTTVGSATQRFKIYNPSNRAVLISSVELLGGESSKFRLNLDGISGVSFEEITIPGQDSIFGFAEVTLDPNDGTLPMIIEDDVLFLTNGIEQKVKLAAWGQDAYFYYNTFFDEGVLPNDKPHVIYGFAGVDSSEHVTVQAGTQFYLHNNSLLYIRKGSIAMEGELENKITFQGDRLEPFYDDVKGQYYGVYFEEALPSTMNHVIIKNGTAGVHVFGNNSANAPATYTLEISNCEIYNHASYGIFNYDGGKIKGENLLVHNNSLYAFFQLEGGAYSFKQSHFLGYGTDGSQPAIAVRNYFTRSDGITYIGEVSEGNIFNSVIYGDALSQVAYDTITEDGAVEINFNFVNNVIRQEEPIEHSSFEGNFWNINPGFIAVSEQNFQYPVTSILYNNGNSSITYTNQMDILGTSRDITTPDIGAYEINE